MFVLYPLVPVTMCLSSSRAGLAATLLLVATRTEQLLALPLYALDPSQPFRPLQHFWFVSHVHRLAGVERVSVSGSPERESLVRACATGSDSFGINLRPSGPFDTLPDSFSRGLLVVVLTALLAAVLVTHRMTKSSRVNAAWA
jgi:hypothetical protein